MGKRVYLDYNATAPLTEAAKIAMIESMDTVGNPSSIHSEGRVAKGIIEKTREQVAETLDVDCDNIIFTSGATEGAALILKNNGIQCSELEHACVTCWSEKGLTVTSGGKINVENPKSSTVQLANSETGVIQSIQAELFMSDVVQAIGKIPFSFKQNRLKSAIISAHKFGGPKGVGAVLIDTDFEISSQIRGGGQENGNRSGTENLIAIAGFGAAIKFAKKRLDDGLWDGVSELRDYFENEVANASPETTFVGQETKRLPNTTCLATPGWKGESQVIQMDLNGFAISSGSACSSGTVKNSNILKTMGYENSLSESAIRVSIGVETTKRELDDFIVAWAKAKPKRV